MRYQIYLDKETTKIVELLAKAQSKKTNTFIKNYLEEVFKTAYGVAVKEYEDSKPNERK